MLLNLLTLALAAVPLSHARALRLDNEPRSDIEERASSVITTCTVPGTFAMTFDDGPLYGGQIATYFEKHNSKATFFVNGNNYDCIYKYAEDLQRRYQAGHQIATWTHPDITTISAAAFENEITLLETALQKILGIKPKYFRPPYGSYNNAALAILKKRGYKVVNWNLVSGDAEGGTASSCIAAYKNVYKKPLKPYIALNHETYQITANNVVPTVVPKLISAGYKLVTVAQCLGDNQPYQGAIGALGKRDSSWTCAGEFLLLVFS
ncbi:hypothetical protein RQP46_007968 [Phenoliferia psychrophenolica]